MDATQESVPVEELKVDFFPALYLQRRIWILNILRRENVSQILEVGCGEGQILRALCGPSPWLKPPPPELLASMQSRVSANPTEPARQSPTYNDENMPDLHIREVHGLDISMEDLQHAIDSVTPPVEVPDEESPGFRSYAYSVQRWEELLAKIWKGGLEVINEEFVGMECIVSTEVIEHLPENVLSAFAPVLLGAYHPKCLLLTTPSYTFNARWTPPDAPRETRRGYPDPTGRTDRIFRHDDHQFEWTREEFKDWCKTTAEEWGYKVEETSIGRGTNQDPYGRDEELEGASSVAFFRRLDTMDNGERAAKGRAIVSQLGLPQDPHVTLATFQHGANPAAMKPRPLKEIAASVKAKMEEFREVFMRVEELWYEKDIAVQCGGWIEMLVCAIEQSPDLNLKKESDGLSKRTENWSVELVGAVPDPDRNSWRESSVDYIPPDWTPGEGPYEAWADDSDMEGGSTGADGDVSTYTSDADGDVDTDDDGTNVGWGKRPKWDSLVHEQKDDTYGNGWTKGGAWGDHDDGGWGHSALSSSAGWDGDESGETTS